MPRPSQTDRVERMFQGMRRHKVLSSVISVGIIIVCLGSFTEALHELWGLVSPVLLFTGYAPTAPHTSTLKFRWIETTITKAEDNRSDTDLPVEITLVAHVNPPIRQRDDGTLVFLSAASRHVLIRKSIHLATASDGTSIFQHQTLALPDDWDKLTLSVRYGDVEAPLYHDGRTDPEAVIVLRREGIFKIPDPGDRSEYCGYFWLQSKSLKLTGSLVFDVSGA